MPASAFLCTISKSAVRLNLATSPKAYSGMSCVIVPIVAFTAAAEIGVMLKHWVIISKVGGTNLKPSCVLLGR
jgi:hypothetical protein